MPQAPTQLSCLPEPSSGNAGSMPVRPRHNADTAAVRRTLDVSSCHLSAETWAWLDAQTTDTAVRDPASRSAEILGGRTRHGWFLYAGLVPAEPVPADLLAVMRCAQRLRCDYVLLDSDARPLEGLPILHPGAPGREKAESLRASMGSDPSLARQLESEAAGHEQAADALRALCDDTDFFLVQP